jgi:hypothetical protein
MKQRTPFELAPRYNAPANVQLAYCIRQLNNCLVSRNDANGEYRKIYRPLVATWVVRIRKHRAAL